MKSLAHQSTQEHTLLKDIRPMMRKLDIEVIVLQQESETVVTRDGKHIYWYLVADKSGVMALKAWGPSGGLIKSGDILHISGIQYKITPDRHLLEISRLGKIRRLGQDTFPFAERPNFSQPSEPPPQSRLLPATAPVVPQQQTYTNTPPLDQLQPFQQPPSSSIRPPPNYITTSSSQVDNAATEPSMTAMNFGPGWMGELGTNRGDTQADMDQQQADTHLSSKKRPTINDNKETIRMSRHKVDYNKLV